MALILCLLPSSASANFGSSDPGDWTRNRCVSRNVMVAGLVSAPVGLGLLAADEKPGRVAIGATLIAASGATLATGMTLRILQPEQPRNINSAYARWAREGCQLLAAAAWGVPVMALGSVILASARIAARNPFSRVTATIMTVAGVGFIAGGLSMVLYGSIASRRRGAQPALDVSTPLLSLPVGPGALQVGATSLGFAGAF